MKLPEFAVNHPAIIAIVLVMLAVFGVIAGSALNSEMIPPVSMPQASIITVYPGAAAKEIEREISRIIENQMSTLAGVTDLSSSSSDSYSVVSMEFSGNVNVQEKLPQIRELLNAVISKLPKGIEGAPVIFVAEAAAFLPIFSVRIDSSMNPVALMDYLETNVSPAIARLSGVSRINLVGGEKQEARIILNTKELEARKISALSVFEALNYNNINMPSGNAMYKSREMSFSTSGSFSDITELGNLTVGFGDGSYIYLKDIAEIKIVSEPQKIRIRSNGKNYVMLDVLKRDEGDTISIVNGSRKVLEDIKQETRGIIDYAVITDQGDTTMTSLKTVITAGVSGLILTILIILLILHDLRATLIISISIPLSILFAIIGIYLTGRSLNLLSLAGITVAIGMIVDNSIVVLENTYKHFLKTGDKRQASLKGAGEVVNAVLGSTTTTICVFAPLLFLTGIIGIIMNDLSLAIVFSIAASALVSVIVVPWLASLILKDPKNMKKPKFLKKIEAGIDKALASIDSFYRKVLNAALKNKALTVTISLSFFVASIILLSILKISFIPPTDTSEFEISMETPAGYSLDRTQAKVDEIDSLVRQLVPEIETAVYYIGSSSAIALSDVPNKAFARIRLVPTKDRKRTAQQIIPLVQEKISSTVSDCDVTVLNGGFDSLLAMGTGGQGYQTEIYGTNIEDVSQTARMVREMLSLDPDVFKTEISVRSDKEQLYANLSQAYMGSLGVTPYEAGITSRILFSGMNAGTLREGGKDFPIRVSSEIADENITDDILNKIALRTRDGRMVTFAAFSSVESRQSMSRIDRKNRNFSVEVRGYLRTEDQSGVVDRMKKNMDALKLPFGVKIKTAGTSELIGDSLGSLSLMLLISVFLVYAVMVIQFERFMQPLIIMASIPLCLIGVVLGLYLFNSALSIIAMLALITLGGTVVNNAIVLVDYTNMLRKDYGMSLDTAVVEGATNRLRPIMMTALTTLLGVLPMALASGNGSEIYAPLGQAIFGGLLTSTIITLILIPVLYDWLEKRKAFFSFTPQIISQEEPHAE